MKPLFKKNVKEANLLNLISSLHSQWSSLGLLVSAGCRKLRNHNKERSYWMRWNYQMKFRELISAGAKGSKRFSCPSRTYSLNSVMFRSPFPSISDALKWSSFHQPISYPKEVLSVAALPHQSLLQRKEQIKYIYRKG